MKYARYVFLFLLCWGLPVLAAAENFFSFDGHVDLLKNEFNVKVTFDESSSVSATASKISETDYRLLLDVDHLKTPLFDLLSKIESTVEVIRQDQSFPAVSSSGTVLRGKIWSQYSLVDYKPAGELSGSFEIRDNRLYLSAVSIGNVRCNGYIDLTKPYKTDIAINLAGIHMSDFLNFWTAEKKYVSSGWVTGDIKASGSLEQLFLKGNLRGIDGFVEKLEFDSIRLNIEGTYPHMKIAQSTVSKSDGVSFNLKGPFDLSDKGNFKKQIKSLTLSPLVNNSGTEGEWTIKRLSPENSGVTELKYRFRRGDALGVGISSGDETDMLGLERTKKF